jgi:hypothetical protein
MIGNFDNNFCELQHQDNIHRKADFYCKKCLELICGTCCMKNHKNCNEDIVDLQEMDGMFDTMMDSIHEQINQIKTKNKSNSRLYKSYENFEILLGDFIAELTSFKISYEKFNEETNKNNSLIEGLEQSIYHFNLFREKIL